MKNKLVRAFSVGLVLVLGLSMFSCKRAVPPTVQGGQTKAAINLISSDKSCQQYAGPDFGHLTKQDFVPLSQKRKETIVWHGELDNGPPNQKVHVTFPSNDCPFSKCDFDEDQDSGPILDSAKIGKKYAYSAVTVGGTPCSSFSDPGVIVMQ